MRNAVWGRQGMELTTGKASSLNFNSTPTPHTREIVLVDKYFFFFFFFFFKGSYRRKANLQRKQTATKFQKFVSRRVSPVCGIIPLTFTLCHVILSTHTSSSSCARASRAAGGGGACFRPRRYGSSCRMLFTDLHSAAEATEVTAC